MVEPENLKVLVIDDEKFTLNMAARLLKGCGLENISTASNGDEALQLLETECVDCNLILCDLNMPGMDGVELLRHLAERSCSADIILVSGEDERLLKSAVDLASAHSLNVLGSIQKPLTPAAVKEMVAKIGSGSSGKRGGYQSQSITEEELRAGIDSDALTPFFQPKVSVADGKLVGVEALVRWKHAERGIVGPGDFVPLAEECGLIDDLTDAVLRKSMWQGGQWLKEGLGVKVSVNVSVASLRRLDLPEFVVEGAKTGGIEPGSVMLEVTESRLMEDIKGPLEILTRLRMKNIGVSIDDFGTGYSSMQQLKSIPFSELKVDRAFVNGAGTDQSAHAILKSSVDLAKMLEISTVAEGVENQEDWDTVAAVGCDLIQGYFVGKPMPGEELSGWYQQWSS